MIPLLADTIKSLLDTLGLFFQVFIHIDLEHPVSDVS
jgi:hypothetical protein